MRTSKNAGFSLLEVVITVAIMMTLTVAVAAMLRGGFDVKEGLSQKARVVHRVQVVMDRLSRDIEHAFVISPKEQQKNPIQRNMKTVFKVEKSGGVDRLSLTTKTHRPLTAGSHESDLTYVVYELRDAQDANGRKHLYRGEAKNIPLDEDMKDPPPMSILARHVKSISYTFWDGEKWSTDSWDSTRGDWRGRLPRMMKITLEVYKRDRNDTDNPGEDTGQIDADTETYGTVVYLSESWQHAELKQPSKSIRWNTF